LVKRNTRRALVQQLQLVLCLLKDKKIWYVTLPFKETCTKHITCFYFLCFIVVEWAKYISEWDIEMGIKNLNKYYNKLQTLLAAEHLKTTTRA
jgi:hypothetical protein